MGTTLLLFGLLGQFDIAPTVSPHEFQSWFDAATDGELVVPKAIARGATRFRYVFVGGFANEQLRGYFVQNIKDLHSMGVPRTSIHTIFPSSRETVEECAQKVREEFFTISSKGTERLVVIAHSRGACDALAFALCEPAFVRDHVEALFLIQGAFGGTALADYVVGEGPSMDKRMPTRFRIIASLVGKLERGLMHQGTHAGLSGLTRGESQPFWARIARRSRRSDLGSYPTNLLYPVRDPALGPRPLSPSHRLVSPYLRWTQRRHRRRQRSVHPWPGNQPLRPDLWSR